jgi:hypothetical protein
MGQPLKDLLQNSLEKVSGSEIQMPVVVAQGVQRDALCPNLHREKFFDRPLAVYYPPYTCLMAEAR